MRFNIIGYIELLLQMDELPSVSDVQTQVK